MEAKHVFKYDIILKSDIDYFKRCIYTNIDFYEKFKNKHSSEEDEWNKMQIVYDEIEKIYFTKEEIDKLKYELCERIINDPNPFLIHRNKWDGGYVVEEQELLENIRTI